MIAKTIKRIAIFTCLVLLIMAIIFYKTFISFLATWSLQTYVMSNWGKSFYYEKIYFNGTQLIILKPQFENDPLFTAEQMIVSCHLNWRKRQLNLAIVIDQPNFHFQTPYSLHWEEWEKLFRREEKWIKMRPSFHLQNGLLTWTLADYSQQQLFFDLKMNSQEGGYIDFHFDPHDSTNNHLALQAKSEANQMEIGCDCQNIKCASLIAFTQFLGFDLSSWLVTSSGTLKGQLKAIFPGVQRPYLEGELIAEQLAFTQLTTQITGKIEQIKLKLEKNQVAYELAEKVPTVKGKIEILKPATLIYSSEHQHWRLDQILGKVTLNEVATALIDLNAQGVSEGRCSNWTLQGITNLNAQRSLNLDLNLFCSSIDQSDGNIHLFLHQPQNGYKQAQIQLQQLSCSDSNFLQVILATYWPIFKEIQLEEGKLNALIEADVTQQGIKELQIKQFQASQVRCHLKPWNAKCYFNQAQGLGSVHLGEADIWSSLQAEMHLEDGEVWMEEVKPSLPLTAIQAHLMIKKGSVAHSLVTLQLAGLKGSMDIEWGDSKQLLTVKLEGMVEDLTELLPIIIQEGIKHHFHDNRLTVLANLKRHNQQFELGGTLHIQRAFTNQMDLIHFGCELKKFDQDPETKFVPFGWFYAHQLPLERFLSPFIFRNGEWSMQGEAEVKGSFDDQCLTLKYDAEALKIENEDFCIEANHLHSPVPGQLLGFHQIDLNTYSHQGVLPIQQASYFAKNKGLIFQDIQGLVTFKDQIIRISPLEAYCEGSYFAGTLELDYSNQLPGVFNVRIHCPTLSGKVSQIQHLLAHMDHSSPLNKIPLEGEVSAKGEGLKLNFAFTPEDYHLQANVRGTIANGSLTFEEADLSLKGIYMDMDFDHQQQKLEFTDIQGTLLVGKPRRVEEYLLTGHHMSFYQLANPDINLDIAVRDQKEELLRLVGNTYDEGQGIKNLYLDPHLSHISCLYPHVWQCRLKEWSNFEQFELHSQFNIAGLLNDLQKFRHTGLFFLSPSIIDRLTQFLPLEGPTSLTLSYHPKDQAFDFQMTSDHLKQGMDNKHTGFLKGRKQDKKWMIDHLQWDDWNIYTELQQASDKWKIPFLGVTAGDYLLLGLEGEFLSDENLLQAKINLGEINLEKINHWEFLQPFLKQWELQGSLRATGSIEWKELSSNPLSGLTANLQAELNDLAIRKFPLKILHPFQIELQADQNLCLHNVQLEFSPQHGRAFLDIQQLNYQSSQERISCPQLIFHIPSTYLEPVGNALYHHFPDLLNSSIKDILVSCKQQGQLKGKLQFENNRDQLHLQLKLDDGCYQFKKRDYDLKDFELTIADNELNFLTFSHEERCPFKMTGNMSWPSCQKGSCTFTHSEDNLPLFSYQPLLIHWDHHPLQGFTIRSIQGYFSGCSFNLMQDKETNRSTDWSALQGQVVIDFNQLCPLLSPPIVDAIKKLKLGSSYIFQGHFWMNPNLGNKLSEIVFFQGHCSSQNTSIKGYEIQNLQTNMYYKPGRLEMQNFIMQDDAGSMHASNPTALLDQKTDRWSLFIPRLTIKNLRPCFLRVTDSDHTLASSKFRSLLIKRIELQDFFGELNNVHTWQAQGSLHFLNPARKNLYHPLLAIPAEIILRLGLDPQVLNPVTGTLLFDLRGDRFYFTRLKDVYSEGRGSKFYLAQGPTPSWMDFDGNLSVHIRMKQYNLIFKIAELFTVSIQGHIKKPRYQLQKHSKIARKEGIKSWTRKD